MTDHTAFSRVVNDPFYRPRWGWHDDHAAADRTPQYLPAVQQDSDEFFDLLCVIKKQGLVGGSCLQLGVGPCAASHQVWREVFDAVVSVDLVLPPCPDMLIGAQGNTRDPRVVEDVRSVYDFLFIDAGHGYEDVAGDHALYAPMVRSGGIVAFHDAAKRPGYEDEIGVWRWLADNPWLGISLIVGRHQIGTAYYVVGGIA